ncbi:MAG: hypothetical protein V3V20_05505 [Algisphaera sp.]
MNSERPDTLGRTSVMRMLLAGTVMVGGLWLAQGAVGPQPAIAQTAQRVRYGAMQAPGRIDDPRIDQSSGLAASLHEPGLLWTHNDSGHKPTLYLLNRDGTTRASVTLKVSGTRDIEDVCSFELDGVPHLLVADVGDNRRQRKSVSLFLIEEPQPYPGQNVRGLRVKRRIDLTYADGPQDCESVAFDPATRSILLVTKSWPDVATLSVPAAGLYVCPLGDDAPKANGEPQVLERVADLTLKITTAADMSPDGTRMVVMTYGDAYQYVREADQTWAQVMAQAPTRIALSPRGQSEAVCYGLDGKTLWVTSEGKNRPLWRVSP